MPHAIVVGAGIAGLVATRALRARGWQVTLVERTPAPAPIGAGIVLGANAIACLDTLGLGGALRAAGSVLPGFRITDAQGDDLQTVRIAEVAPGAEMIAFERPALHEVLLDGLEVRWGTPVESVDARGATLAGERVEAELVVGADGIHSRVRASLVDIPLRYAGQTCWRTLGRDVVGEPYTIERWGPGVRVGTVPLRGGRLYSFLVATAPAGSPDRPSSPEEVAARFTCFGDLVPRILGASEARMHHDLHDLPRQSWGEGRLVLIGDAAHAMTPNMGQGAGMGVEDGLVLAEVAGEPDPASALAARRQRRVAAIAARSWQLGTLAHWENALARGVRDLLVRWTPASVSAAQMRQLLKEGPVGV